MYGHGGVLFVTVWWESILRTRKVFQSHSVSRGSRISRVLHRPDELVDPLHRGLNLYGTNDHAHFARRSAGKRADPGSTLASSLSAHLSLHKLRRSVA